MSTLSLHPGCGGLRIDLRHIGPAGPQGIPGPPGKIDEADMAVAVRDWLNENSLSAVASIRFLRTADATLSALRAVWEDENGRV
jgi:hypothetical protein